MSKSKLTTGSNRRRFSEEFKREALLLANRIGIAEASKQLGVGDSQLYYWRSKSKTNSSTTEREQQVLAENARLKRLLVEKEEELAIVKKAAKYFAKESG